ncbi:hypothetical protein MHYP_G00056670 [Metynnis hypsauchen]
MPIEYVVEKGRKTVAYVPLLQMLQKMLNKQDVFRKTSSTPVVVPNEFNTCRDGKWFRENDLLSSDELTLALNLYIDDFEVANHLPCSAFLCMIWHVLLSCHLALFMGGISISPCPAGVYQEFNRVMGKNLKQEFYDSLDRHCPALVDVMKSKRGLKRQLLDALLRQAQTSDIADMRCLVLRGLAVLLDDDPSEFFKDCFAVDDEDAYKHIPI